MNAAQWLSYLVWGFGATVVLTTILAGSQELRLTRMNVPYLLGTMFTPDRDRARFYGVAIHLLNGLLFALIYVAAFHAWGGARLWRGALIGAIHAAFVLVAAMPTLPSVHPRMASAQQGPTATRQLEPPGFLALHYGRRTPLSVLVAHLFYGAILGAMYET